MIINLDGVAAGVLIVIALVVPAVITLVGTVITSGSARIASQAASDIRTLLTTVMIENNQKLSGLERSATDIFNVSQDTHTLVNSNYGTSLMATLMALRNVARLTTDPDAKLLADAAVAEAERLYNEYLRKQSAVDSVHR